MVSKASSFALVFSLVSLLLFTAETSETLCGEKQPSIVSTPPKGLPKQNPTPLTVPHKPSSSPKPKPSIESSKVKSATPKQIKPAQATSKVSLPPKQKLTPAPTTAQHHNDSSNVKLTPKKTAKVISSKDNDLKASCTSSKELKPSSPHGVVMPKKPMQSPQKPVKLPSKVVKPKSSERVIPSPRKQMHNPDSALYITANSESAS